MLFSRKWIVPAGVAAALVASSLGLSESWSYLKTAHGQIGRKIRDATPIDFDLKRLEQMIVDLVPEIRRNQEVAAQLEVEVEYMQREIESRRTALERGREEMAALRKLLGEERHAFVVAGRSYTRQQVEADLSRRLDRYEQDAAQLAAREELLRARRETLAAATQKIGAYRDQYERLTYQAESLKAELALVEAAQAAGSLALDDSKLGEARQLAQEVEKRIRAVARLVDAERQPQGEIPIGVETHPAAQRYDELFSGESPAPTAEAAPSAEVAVVEG